MSKKKTLVMSEMSVPSIKKELDGMKVSYDKKAKKLDLFQLLLAERNKTPDKPELSKKAIKAIEKSKVVAVKEEKAKVVRRKRQKRSLVDKPKRERKERKRREKKDVADNDSKEKYVPKWPENIDRKVEKIRDENVFKSGVLCHLRLRKWGAKAKLSEGDRTDDLPKEIISAMQNLLPGFLDNIKENRRRAKNALMSRALYFPVDGLHFIPKEKVVELDEIFTGVQEEEKALVAEAMASYDDRVEDYRKRFPKFYRKDKYPPKEVIRDRFIFEWTFRQFTVPDKEMSILVPEVYKREEEKFKNEMREMRATMMQMVAKSLTSRLNSLKDQCADEKISARTYNSVSKLLDKWDELWAGYIGQGELKKIIDQVKKEMLKTGVDSLKDSEKSRDEFQMVAEKLASQLQNISDGTSRKRKLIF